MQWLITYSDNVCELTVHGITTVSMCINSIGSMTKCSLSCWAYRKAGKGNEVETGNGKWKHKNAPVVDAVSSLWSHKWCALSLLLCSTYERL